MSRLPHQKTALTEVFVIAKSINSLGQVEATVGSMRVALCGPLLECDNVYTLNDMFAEHLKDKPASWVGCEKTQKAEIST